MRKITKKWLEFAQQDLKDAEILFKNKRYLGTIYHCHQAIEKYLKTILVEGKKKVPKTHDLLDLLKQSEVKYTKEILNFIQELNPYYAPIRYPDIPEVVSLKLRQEKASKILKSTKEISKWLLFQINPKK
jgi:HEPN domain-containing protein